MGGEDRVGRWRQATRRWPRHRLSKFMLWARSSLGSFPPTTTCIAPGPCTMVATGRWAGTEEGITQVASVPAGRPAKVVWNFPVDLTFKSTNVYGWPQLVLHVHGTDFLNRDIVRGYGSVHLPTSPGAHELQVRVFRPVSSSPLQQLIGWLNGTPAEYVEQKRPAMANGREVTRVESTGVVTVKINVVTRNMKQFGYSLPLATNVQAQKF